MPELRAGGRAIAYRMRRSARARRLRLTIGADGIELVVPSRTSERVARQFVEENRDWLATKMLQVARAFDAHPGSACLVDGARIPFRGSTVPLAITPTERQLVRLRFDEGFHVEVPATAEPQRRERLIEAVLVRWLRRRAAIEAESLVARHGPPNDLVPRAIRIKEQKRLWGSCTAKGVVNLNWRLILGPPAVFEYLVVHELAHLRERSHQPPFWDLVASLLPGFADQRRWLKANGHLLTLRPTGAF